MEVKEPVYSNVLHFSKLSSSSSHEKSSIFNQLRELFIEKYNIIICTIRLAPYAKTPTDPGWTDPDYDPTPIPWHRHYGNIGIIPGRSNLLIIDCDTSESIKFFIELANRINLPTETLVIMTRRGAHYYYYCTFSNELEKKQFSNQAQNIKIDLLAGNKCQVVAPYSQLKLDESGNILKPDAKEFKLFIYEPILIPEKLVEITEDLYNTLINELGKTLLKPKPQAQAEVKAQVTAQTTNGERHLTDEEIAKIAETLNPYFVEGQRQNLLLYLAGYLRKDLNISEESVYKLYELLQAIDDKNDIEDRLEAIKRSYEKDLKDVSGRKGLSEKVFFEEEKTKEFCSRIEQALGIQKQETKKKKDDVEEEFTDKPYQEAPSEETQRTKTHAQGEKKEDKKRSIFEKILELFIRENFWLSEYDEAYFSVSKIKHYRIESKRFKEYLQDLSIRAYRQPLHNQAMENLIQIFQFWARENTEKHGKKYKVFSRIGYSEEENFIEINLLREDNKILRISAEKIELDAPQLKFVPTPNQLPILHFSLEEVLKMQGKKIEAQELLQLFQQVFNIQTTEDLALLTSWMLKTFYEPGEYPILVLQGEREGVGKTTFSKFLALLLDPNTTLIKTFPKTVDDLFVVARNSFILVFDNISNIDEPASDALCQLATGGSISKRKLYTDFDAINIALQRPVILNSIYSIARRRDLRRRSIILELKKPTEPKTLRELQENFNKIAPIIYAYLVLCVQEALKNKKIENTLVDLADFTEFICKSYPVFFVEPEKFIEILKENRKQAARESLESNLILPLIEEKLANYVGGVWQTTAKDLLQALKEKYPHEKNLPTSPEWLSRRLREIATDLEEVALIKVDFVKSSSKKKIVFSKLIPVHDPQTNNDNIPF